MSDQKDEQKNTGLYEERRVYGTKKQMEKLNAAEKPEKVKKTVNNDHFTILVVVVMVVFMLVISIGIASLFKKPSEKKTGEIVKPTEKPEEKPVISDFNGIVLRVDTADKKIFLFNVDSEKEMELTYDGATKFYGSAGSQITAGVVEVGDLMHFTVGERGENKISSANWDKDVWEKSKIDDMLIYPEENRIVIRNRNYRYSDNVCIIDNGVRKDIGSLLPTADRYTVRGQGTTVYEIIVSIGHGTLKLENYEAFNNGLVMIGARYNFDIEEPGEYTVREGEYRITASYGRLEASETITIPRNDTAVFDLQGYRPAVKSTPTPTPSPEPTPTPIPVDHEFSHLTVRSLENFSHDVDKENATYILGPAGGELFLDGYYFGKLPCEFEKITDRAEITIAYDAIHHSYEYNGADYDGDVILDYTSDFVE
ncbi:MAG: hypothetical protein K6G60_00485 [Lachnospiraceae bacterium]|nr:hypothetical protein [Lachnospiraceae bacterium]